MLNILFRVGMSCYCSPGVLQNLEFLANYPSKGRPKKLCLVFLVLSLFFSKGGRNHFSEERFNYGVVVYITSTRIVCLRILIGLNNVTNNAVGNNKGDFANMLLALFLRRANYSLLRRRKKGGRELFVWLVGAKFSDNPSYYFLGSVFFGFQERDCVMFVSKRQGFLFQMRT